MDSWLFRSPPAVPARLSNFPASVLSPVESQAGTCSHRPPSKTLCKWQKGFQKGNKKGRHQRKLQGFWMRLQGTEHTVSRAQGHEPCLFGSTSLSTV